MRLPGICCAICVGFMSMTGLAKADRLELLIQPTLSKSQTERFYQPLADYLGRATGHDIKVISADNFLAYWNALRSGQEYHLVLDAAHFTDYRVKHLGYDVLAKISDTITYSLVTTANNRLKDPQVLNGKTVATVTSPGLGGIQLFRIYNNPLRQPVLRETANFGDAIELLKQKKVFAAFVPTPLLQGETSMNTLLTTRPLPQMALSASPSLGKTTRDDLTRALLRANNTSEGRKLFQRLNIKGFEAADASTYDGYMRLLEGTFGY